VSKEVTTLAVDTRQTLIDTLAPLGRPSGTESIAIVGLPGFGADELLRRLEKINGDSGARTARLRLEELRLADGPAQLLDGLLHAVSSDAGLPDGSFEEKLSFLRELGTAQAQSSGDLPILFLEGLHEIARVDSSKQAKVQAILDCLQAAATEEPRWARVWSSSHIEPARACESIGWSSFYKVFGPRVYYLGPVERAHAKSAMLGLVEETHEPSLAAAAVDEALDHLPLVPRVLAEAVIQIETNGRLGANGLLACRLQLADLCRRWQELLEGDFAVLEQLEVSKSLKLGPALTSARRLQRLGLVVEDTDGFRTAQNLVCDRSASDTTPPDGDSYVRGMWRIPSVARALVKRVLTTQGVEFAELELLQHREGEALVMKVVREDSDGLRLRPWILKLDSKSSIEREAELTESARGLLGPAVPQVLSVTSDGATGCVLSDFACADGRSFSVRTLEDLMLASDGVVDPADMLDRLLGSVLAALYGHCQTRTVKLRGLYHIPRPAELGALLALTDASKSDFTDESSLSEAMELVFGQSRATLVCPKVHGDLNARNILIDGAQNVHAIDFSTFKEGLLAKDFARLETEILFRVFDHWSAEMAWAFAHLLSTPDLVNAARILCALSTSPELTRVARCIYSLRRTCLGYWVDAGSLGTDTFRSDYLAALAASALRTALFQDYSSSAQREAAVTYGFAALREVAVASTPA